MSRIAALLILAAAFAGATAAAPVATPPPKGFVSDKTINYWGYYQPVKPALFGKWKLDVIALGTPADFKRYEAGFRTQGITPDAVLTVFEISFAGKEPGPDGFSVAPAAYRVTGNTVSFVGDSKELGPVRFEGAFSAPFFKRIASHHEAHNGPAVVMTGTLTAGGASVPVSFTWFDGGSD